MIEGALTGFLGSQVRLAPAGSLQGETADWLIRVKANAGTVSAATLLAVDAFVRGCKADSIWSKLSRVNLMCGDQLAACLVPLMVGAGNATDTNSGFGAGNYTESGGLQGGASRYLDTGIVPPTATGGMGAYTADAIASGATQVVIGTRNTAVTQLFRIIQAGADSRAEYGALVSALKTAGTPAGCLSCSRTSSTRLDYYQAGASVANSTASATASAITASFFVFAQNRGGGTASDYYTGRIRAYWVDTGLSATDSANLYTRMQAFQTALGRNV